MRTLGITILIVLFALSVTSAEEIQLKDGSKISGKLTGITNDSFQIKTNYGEINVPRSQVINISFPENQAAQNGANSVLPPIDESLSGTDYINRTAGFQMKVPAGWKLAPELRKSKDIVAALMSQDQTLFFLATPEQFAGTLETYRVLAETQFQTKFNDFEKLQELSTEVDGRKSYRLVWHGKTKDTNAELKFLVYIIGYQGRMVRLSFFTLEPLFDEGLNTFEKMASSYRTLATQEKPAKISPAEGGDAIGLRWQESLWGRGAATTGSHRQSPAVAR